LDRTKSDRKVIAGNTRNIVGFFIAGGSSGDIGFQFHF
jgi:hypothetical protein